MTNDEFLFYSYYNIGHDNVIMHIAVRGSVKCTNAYMIYILNVYGYVRVCVFV